MCPLFSGHVSDANSCNLHDPQENVASTQHQTCEIEYFGLEQPNNKLQKNAGRSGKPQTIRLDINKGGLLKMPSFF